MIKATRIINPNRFKVGDIVLSRHTPCDPRVWFTFRVRGATILDHGYILIHPDNRFQSDVYYYADNAIFYKLSEEIGWFWGDRYGEILRAMGGHLNLGI